MVALLLTGFVIYGSASATTYTFNDTNFEWIGVSGVSTVPTALVGTDAVGNPDIIKMDINVNNNSYIESIIIYHDPDTGVGLFNSPGIPGSDIPGDFISLFINTDSLGYDWDYYMKLENTGSGFLASAYDIRGVSWEYDFPENYPEGFTGGSRFGHPGGIITTGLTSSASILDGTPDVSYSGLYDTVTYNFADDVIQLENTFAIGATQYCANDNFFAEVSKPAEVPEPMTIYLMGTGIICFVRLRRKKSVS